MIASVLFYAVITACLCIFYEFITREEMLLHWWYRLISRLEATPYEWLFKILGGCIYCNAPYLSTLFLILCEGSRQILSFEFIAYVLLLNHLLLRIFSRYDNQD